MNNTDQFIASLADSANAVKPARGPWAICARWIVLSIIYMAVIIAFSGVRPDILAKFHWPIFAAEMAALIGIFLSTALSAAILSFPDMHGMRRLAYAPLVFFALFITIIFRAWQMDAPPAPLPEHSHECTVAIMFYALFPGIAIFLTMRRFASTHAMVAGGVAVLAAFSVGAIILRFIEQTDSMVHLITWHYVPMIVVGLLGLALGKKFLKW